MRFIINFGDSSKNSFKKSYKNYFRDFVRPLRTVSKIHTSKVANTNSSGDLFWNRSFCIFKVMPWNPFKWRFPWKNPTRNICRKSWKHFLENLVGMFRQNWKKYSEKISQIMDETEKNHTFSDFLINFGGTFKAKKI